MRIKSVQIQNSNNNGRLYEIGKSGVHRIENSWDPNYNSYRIFAKSGNMIALIENCPVLVEMSVPENEQVKQKEIFPEKPPEKFSAKKALQNMGVEADVASDWLKIRSKKGAVNTERAFKAIEKEIQLSGLKANECIIKAVEGSWKGFKAEYVINKESNNNGPTKLSTEF